ncbi:MAG: hypothetical protein PUJ57_06150 [Peptoniphilaceae bacterium]|nr:hypothetical protein [Peptoniphilaceae bacterium]MDY6085730.1 hypothetical protein [Peptoniphilaceae bacterium]
MKSFAEHFLRLNRRKLLILALVFVATIALPLYLAPQQSADTLGTNVNEVTDPNEIIPFVFTVPPVGYDPKAYHLPIFWLLQHYLVVFPVSLLLWQYHRNFSSSYVLILQSRRSYFNILLMLAVALPLCFGLVRLALIAIITGQMTELNLNNFQFSLKLFAMFMAEDVFFCLLSLTIALYGNIRSGAMTSLSLILLSTFFPTPFLPGQASMAIRQQEIMENGFSFSTEVVIYGVYLSAVLLAYEAGTRKYDFLFSQE